MAMNYVEAVVRADGRFVKGFLKGYLAGSGKAYRFFISEETGIKAESLSDKLKELVGLAENHQHIVIEEQFWTVICSERAAAEALGLAGELFQSRRIKRGEFSLKIRDCSKADAGAIKEILQQKPEAVQVSGWQEQEKVHQDGKGIELYTPVHDYVYEASGSFAGEIEALVELRQSLTSHSPVVAGLIELEYEGQ
jgi:hypothetical protein